MDDLFPLLLFLIFVLGPILEGLKRKNKQPPPPPPQRRRMPQPPQQREVPAEPSRTEEISSRRNEESAATMVPNDLWEILTGQKPLPPVPTTPKPPAPVATKRQPWDVVFDPDEEDEESGPEAAPVEQVNVETRRERGAAQSLETLERHPVPVVVSLEDNIPTTRQRHEAFHRKVAAPLPAPKAKVPRRPVLNLKNRSELQRAILMQEILGKPKGLE